MCMIFNRNSTTTSNDTVKTLNVCMPFILRMSRAKQNREIKGCEYQLQSKIGQNYYSISNCMVLIRQNERGQNKLAC